MKSSELVLGVDGGGTKTVAWLAPRDDDGSGTILGRAQAGPGNPRAVGFDTAQESILTAIESAFADARLPREPAAAACFGLAGAGRPVEQERLVDWALRQQIAKRVRVTGDAEPIVAAASPDNAGVALISGTGSFAWGRNSAGETARAGGWGYLIGDEGSGYAIALSGLRAAVRAADGRGPPTRLLDAFLQALGVKSAEELIGKVYSPEMTRDRVAELASAVFHNRDTDALAGEIVAAAARDLAEMVLVVAGQLHLRPREYTLALTGGVLTHQAQYVAQICAALSDPQERDRGAAPQCHVIVKEPARGAVALARRLANSIS